VREPPKLVVPPSGIPLATAMRQIYRDLTAAMAWINEACEEIEAAAERREGEPEVGAIIEDILRLRREARDRNLPAFHVRVGERQARALEEAFEAGALGGFYVPGEPVVFRGGRFYGVTCIPVDEPDCLEVVAGPAPFEPVSVMEPD
jgi:hypothetical protein